MFSDTVNTLFGTEIRTAEEMEAWLDQRRPKENIITLTHSLAKIS